MNNEFEVGMTEEDNLQYYSRKEKQNKGKKRKPSKVLLVLGVLSLMVVLFIMSPFFAVKNINVTEMERFSQSEILEKAQLEKGDNILFLSPRKIARTLEKDTHFESVEVSRQFPDTVDIEIKERRVRGYVPYMGSYLYIDEYGRVLEISSSYIKQLPIVEGLEFDRFTIGEKIDADNYEAFNVMVIIAQMMTKYDLLDNVVRIDVSDTNNIVAHVKKIEVNLGDISNSDQKIRAMGEIIKQIPEGDRGTLDLSDVTKPIVFKYLT